LEDGRRKSPSSVALIRQSPTRRQRLRWLSPMIKKNGI